MRRGISEIIVARSVERVAEAILVVDRTVKDDGAC